jgi:hypothetical protein
MCLGLNAVAIVTLGVAGAFVVLYGRVLEALVGLPVMHYAPIGFAFLAAVSLAYGGYAVFRGKALHAGGASAVGGAFSLAFVVYYTLVIPLLSWLGILAYALPLAPFASSLIAWLRKEEVTGRTLA